MHPDPNNQYREKLENDPPNFLDRVDTPWDKVPDLEGFNQTAYKRILRSLNSLKQAQTDHSGAKAKGILILGEAGAGKTHLLYRVRTKLSGEYPVLFVRKPNNQDAVAQHIWTEIVSSLGKEAGAGEIKKSQIEVLLAHVFSAVLIPEFKQDIDEGKDAEQKERWVKRLENDPYHLFNMLGAGESRQRNMETLRRRTIRYFDAKHPNADQDIVKALITLCFLADENKKRLLKAWLSGQELDSSEADQLGLTPSWVKIDENSSEISLSSQREEKALKAIQTIGILSTYYRPLILAFDQLEGLRKNEQLTQIWGDKVREIFTMTPNLLIITCIFPSLWDEWFEPTFRTHDQSVIDRIAQEKIQLETFSETHGITLLASRLKTAFLRHQLPDEIYPFTKEDVRQFCEQAKSPRRFLQLASERLDTWLDGEMSTLPILSVARVTTQDDYNQVIRDALLDSENKHKHIFQTQTPIEHDFFGKIQTLVRFLVEQSEISNNESRASLQQKVLSPNFILQHQKSGNSICLSITFAEGNSLAARTRNLLTLFKAKQQFKNLILLRDRRCKQAGKATQGYLDEIQKLGGFYTLFGDQESAVLSAIYDTLVSIEQKDLSVNGNYVEKSHLFHFLKSNEHLLRSTLMRAIIQNYPVLGQTLSTRQIDSPHKPLSSEHSFRVPIITEIASISPTKSLEKVPHQSDQIPTLREQSPTLSSPQPQPPPLPVALTRTKSLPTIFIGTKQVPEAQYGIVGTLNSSTERVAVSFAKPMCSAIIGYMGSGKSYALGVLIENALMQIPKITVNQNPLAVIAFNYRRNSEARFEYTGYSQANQKPSEVQRLIQQYDSQPQAVQRLNILAYSHEITRRSSEYGNANCLPLQFRSSELEAEHWELLMKPNNSQAGYMSIIRDNIRKLFYADDLSLKSLRHALQTDRRLSNTQQKLALTRISFVEQWVSDDRGYDWKDIVSSGSLTIVDLRMQTSTSDDALKICLVVTDIIRRTKNGVNKMIVYDEAHEYVDSKNLVAELENALTQIRHDGLSFVLATQFPERIPEQIFKYLLTRFIFKIPTQKSINYLKKLASNLAHLPDNELSNLGSEQGVCFLQTDDECTSHYLNTPQLITIRPRVSHHGGETLRQLPVGKLISHSKSS